MGITIVTAFYDIGRSGWSAFGRSTDDYIRSFLNYIKLGYDIVVFIDDRICTDGWDGCKIVRINKEWLMENTASWRRLQVVRSIMDSKNFRRLVGSRIEHKFPENVCPEYNVINYCKTDFLRIVAESMDDDNQIIAWSDFGYFHAVLQNNEALFPSHQIDPSRLVRDRMNFFLVHPPPQSVDNLLTIVAEAPEIFTGSFFAGSVRLLRGEFFSLFNECLDDLHQMGATDDDQTIYLMCYLRRPGIFALHGMTGQWPKAILDLQA